MTDPLQSLRIPLEPVDPDAGFAARLRARIARALTLPQGVDVTVTTLEEVGAAPATAATTTSTAASPGAGPARPLGLRHGDVGHISYQVPDVDRAAAFYGHVLGWTFRTAAAGSPARPVVDTAPMVNVWPASGVPGPMLTWRVDDLDDAVARVRAAGGSVGAANPEPWGRMADCVDDQGMRFGLWEPLPEDRPGPAAGSSSADEAARAAARNGLRPGDTSYVTMEVRDSARARAFYGTVLGWRFHPGRVEDGWGVDDPLPMVGMAGGSAAPLVVLQFRVDDIHAAVDRVRAAGGSSTDPERYPYGWAAECTDDQGIRFYLGQMAPGAG
ncbi:MAG TPA: VOC family protein [Acidimicrobiales bacterium]|nr:VOC family protein [Acidimicrobiales bacterium]